MTMHQTAANDWWLNNRQPSVEEVAAEVLALRWRLSDLRTAEAHCVGYIREKLDLGDLDDDPDFLDYESDPW